MWPTTSLIMSMLESHCTPIWPMMPAILSGSPLSLIWDINLASSWVIRSTVRSRTSSEGREVSALRMFLSLCISFFSDIARYFFTTFLALLTSGCLLTGRHIVTKILSHLARLHYSATGARLTGREQQVRPIPSQPGSVQWVYRECTPCTIPNHHTSPSYILQNKRNCFLMEKLSPWG